MENNCYFKLGSKKIHCTEKPKTTHEKINYRFNSCNPATLFLVARHNANPTNYAITEKKKFSFKFVCKLLQQLVRFVD